MTVLSGHKDGGEHHDEDRHDYGKEKGGHSPDIWWCDQRGVSEPKLGKKPPKPELK